ncbi:hypothetical protein NP233_g12567 [Leucocoprinus birnbaumii]|uniref:Uncharacterized protein n=1 Tax=Leucocoprinus birnbaumii TaxID=56174 RepID=A0AAD5YMY5_9AGAR|nr:hypothetical protein NP233_g12567 [Leucocoprinus birnbaumii]
MLGSDDPILDLDPALVLAMLESRILAILRKIEGVPKCHADSFHFAAVLEAATYMSYISTQVACGHVIHVPLILWVLAGHLNYKDQCVHIYRALRDAVDASSDMPFPISKVVKHEGAWWTSNQSLNLHDVLSWDTMYNCIRFHQEQLKKKNIIPPYPDDPSSQPNMDPLALPDLDCAHCILYQGCAMDAFHHLCSLRQHTQRLQAGNEDKWHLTMHQASGFHQLTEVASAKEVEHALKGYEAEGTMFDKSWGSPPPLPDYPDISSPSPFPLPSPGHC